MTSEEALEYLNLPANPRKQLVRKRYLELKEDYLKAIFNAPSDHIGSLYKENLQKIEEAYNLLVEAPEDIDTDIGNTEIGQTIKDIQHTVDSIFQSEGGLDASAKIALKQCIVQIDQLQQTLKDSLPKEPSRSVSPTENFDQTVQETRTDESSESEVLRPTSLEINKDNYESNEPEVTNTKSPSWRWEVNKPIQDEPAKDEPVTDELKEKKSKNANDSKKSWLPEILMFESWFVERVSSSSQYSTSADRSYLYRRLIMLAILTVVILGALGTLYVFFPLFS